MPAATMGRRNAPVPSHRTTCPIRFAIALAAFISGTTIDAAPYQLIYAFVIEVPIDKVGWYIAPPQPAIPDMVATRPACSVTRDLYVVSHPRSPPFSFRSLYRQRRQR